MMPMLVAKADTAAECEEGIPPVSSIRSKAQRRSVIATRNILRICASAVAVSAAQRGVFVSTLIALYFDSVGNGNAINQKSGRLQVEG
jgi:hypothetical protein